jgi:hypothetical protein
MVILDLWLSDLKDAFSAFPDKRKGEGGYTIADKSFVSSRRSR